jgi:tRNA (uracil-5-)-methyltransferase
MPLSAIQPGQYDKLLQDKVATTRKLLAPHSPPEPDVVPSPPTGFRLRAEFRMWHDGDALDYVMFRRDDPKTPVPITEFPIAAQSIQALMPVLREKLARDTILRRKLFQAEFLATLSGDMLVTLIYHRPLDDAWELAAAELRKHLQTLLPDLSLVGRSRKQKLVLGRDYVQETLETGGEAFRYRQYEQAFSQPNGRVNTGMIEWACQQARELSGDLLELYCGNGNFTLPLSRHFDNVIATELAKVSVRAARANIEANAIDNVQLIRLSAEEVTQAITGVREFRRLRDLPKALAEYALGTLFVDPPRAGLDDATVAMAAGFDSILYISCNPITLAENLAALDKTHAIKQFALF